MITVHVDFESGKSINHRVGDFEAAAWYLSTVALHPVKCIYFIKDEDHE